MYSLMKNAKLRRHLKGDKYQFIVTLSKVFEQHLPKASSSSRYCSNGYQLLHPIVGGYF